MKKQLLSICIVLMLITGLFPAHAFAINTDNQGFQAFLESIDWEAEEYEHFLGAYGFNLDDFKSLSELGTPATEEALEELLAEHDLTYEEADEQFREAGLLLDGEEMSNSPAFMFIESVEVYMDYILGDPDDAADTAAGTITEENLAILAQDFGFASIDELEELFNAHGDSINNYSLLLDVQYAAEYYTLESGASLSEADSALQEDDGWNEYIALITDIMQTSFLTDEPVASIYEMIAAMFLETVLDFN